MYYDENGQPITLEQWADALEQPHHVGNTVLKGPARGTKWVSTIWLGSNQNFGNGPPLIFESMVFATRPRTYRELACERYATKVEAQEGHAALCCLWQYNRATRRKLLRKDKP